MTRLADTVAAELAAVAWLGIDAPGDPAGPAGIRLALQTGLPGDVSLEDVAEWGRPLVLAIDDAIRKGDALVFEARIVGALSAALILGAKLHETAGT